MGNLMSIFTVSDRQTAIDISESFNDTIFHKSEKKKNRNLQNKSNQDKSTITTGLDTCY